MNRIFERTEQLLGNEAVEVLKQKHIVIVGLGGVGSFACEAIARCGVRTITVIDKDVIDETNINRQLFALSTTINKKKSDLAKERILLINPNCRVNATCVALTEENVSQLIPEDCDYIIDAIDMIASKMAIIKEADRRKIPVISSMGMGNKTDPTKLNVADIYKTSICPLAKIIRKLCKEARIKRLKVVYSSELPLLKRTPPASIVFVPSSAGILLAREVVMDMIEKEELI